MSIMRSSTLAILVFLLGMAPQYAAAQQKTCATLLEEAEAFYVRGGFDEAIATVDQCLVLDAVSESERRNGYRLKGLSYIGKGLEVDARESVKRLLELVPSYEPDPVMDPPNFVQMVTEMRAEIEADAAVQAPAPTPEVEVSPVQEEAVTEDTPPVVTTTPSRRKKKSGKKWLIGGLGVAAAGGLAYVLLSGSGSDAGQSIADPPALP